MERGDDLFGDTVNLASRLADVASRGQIILSQDTTQRLAKGLRAACRPLYSIPVKGKNDDIVQVLRASMAAPHPGRIYNLADDEPEAPDKVVAFACGLV